MGCCTSKHAVRLVAHQPLYTPEGDAFPALEVQQPEDERLEVNPLLEGAQAPPFLRAKEQVAVSNKSFMVEHYCRLPKAKNAKAEWTNLWGVLNTPMAQAAEMFLLSRVLTVYDIGSDIAVTLQIDRHRDPIWFGTSIGLMVLPICVKCVVFYRTGTHFLQGELARSLGMSSALAEAVARLGCTVFGVVLYTLLDVYLLLLYPWVSPTDAAFLGTVERLSPIIETFLEGICQSTFQVYMWVRCQFLEDHERDDGVERLLLCSFLPSLCSIFLKIYDLHKDAKHVDMGFFEYAKELVKGPLGLSAPFLTLLHKRDEVHYDAMGLLTTQQQGQIFRAIGPDNTKLRELTFDTSNGVDIVKLGDSIKANPTLQFVEVSGTFDLETITTFFEHVSQNPELSVCVNKEVWSYDDREEILKACDAVRSNSATAEQATRWLSLAQRVPGQDWVSELKRILPSGNRADLDFAIAIMERVAGQVETTARILDAEGTRGPDKPDVGAALCASLTLLQALDAAVTGQGQLFPEFSQEALDKFWAERSSPKKQDVKKERAAAKGLQDLALISQGAELLPGDHSGSSSMLLLRYDEVFPGVELLGFRGVPGTSTWDDLKRALVNRGWKKYSEQFIIDLYGAEEVIVKLRGDGARLTKVGFTYSPRYRNYGEKCQIAVSEDGEEFAAAGDVGIPRGTERGDPSEHSVMTLFAYVPPLLAKRRTRFVRWSWPGGVALFFVYAMGFP